MAHYTELQDHEIQEIATRYRLDITSFQPIDQGAGNSNYIVNTKHGLYILTIFEIDPIRVVNMCKVLLLLEKHAFPAPKIQKLPNGELLTDFQGKPVILKPYIIGLVVDDLNDDQLNQLGCTLAEMHEISVPAGLPDQHGYILKEYPQVIEKGSDHTYVRWVTNRYRYLMQNIPPGLPSGLIHGDLFCDNVLFDGLKFKAILDFEDVCHYFYAFDIGMAIVGLCTENKRIDLVKASSVVSGYQKVRFIEGAERENLQALTECAAILTSVWRYWKYNIDLTDTTNSNNYIELVKIAKDIAAIPKTRFIQKVFGT